MEILYVYDKMKSACLNAASLSVVVFILFLKHCTCVFTCALAWVWCQRKLAEVSSRLLFGFQELNSGYLT